MDYKEAIDYIKWMQGNFYSDKSHEACDMAISALEQQGQDRWTKVTEKMPDPWELVWVTDREGGIDVCQLSRKDGDWYDEDDEWLYYRNSIVAWMPYTMPEPYKAEERDG